jgi:hypothetical protein
MLKQAQGFILGFIVCLVIVDLLKNIIIDYKNHEEPPRNNPQQEEPLRKEMTAEQRLAAQFK